MQRLAILPSLDQLVTHDQVRLGYEWMTVTLALRPQGGAEPAITSGCGLSLSIISSYGCFGFEWPQTGASTVDQAYAFLAGQAKECLLSKILRHDAPQMDFDGSCEKLLIELAHMIERPNPEVQEAQLLRETYLQVGALIEDMDDDLCDDHKWELLTSISSLWDVFPDGLEYFKTNGPSYRRKSAEAFFDHLWSPYMDAKIKSQDASQALSPHHD